jgi:hypothetical protein
VVVILVSRRRQTAYCCFEELIFCKISHIMVHLNLNYRPKDWKYYLIPVIAVQFAYNSSNKNFNFLLNCLYSPSLPCLDQNFPYNSYYFYYANWGLCTFFPYYLPTILALDHNMVAPRSIVFADCNYNFGVERD